MEKPEYLKLTHGEVKYEHPAKKAEQRCRLCRHFIPERGEEDKSKPRCEIVRQPIRAGDWCERFERKPNDVMARLGKKGASE